MRGIARPPAEALLHRLILLYAAAERFACLIAFKKEENSAAVSFAGSPLHLDEGSDVEVVGAESSDEIAVGDVNALLRNGRCDEDADAPIGKRLDAGLLGLRGHSKNALVTHEHCRCVRCGQRSPQVGSELISHRLRGHKKKADGGVFCRIGLGVDSTPALLFNCLHNNGQGRLRIVEATPQMMRSIINAVVEIVIASPLPSFFPFVIIVKVIGKVVARRIGAARLVQREG